MAPKKGRKLAAELSSSRSLIPGEEQAIAHFRFLLLDYEELKKKTGSKKKHLQEANQKKQKLLAQVRFLRKKYKDLSGKDNPSGKIGRYGLKRRLNTQFQPIDDGQVSNLSLQITGVPFEQICSAAGEDAAPSTLKIDLNQIAEETEFNISWEPLKMNMSKCSTKGKFLHNDQDGVNKVGNRKIKRQDQLNLSCIKW